MKNLSLSIIVSAVGEQCHLIHPIVSYRQLYLSLTRDYNTADYLTGQHREPVTFQHLILNHIFCGKVKPAKLRTKCVCRAAIFSVILHKTETALGVQCSRKV